MDQVPLLTARTGPRAGQRFVIDAEGLVVGRDPGCEVHVDDPGVSREHARVFLHNASVWVQDTGSRNGIYVNGKRVTRPKQVGPGDELKIGEHRFMIELGAAEDAIVSHHAPAAVSPEGPTGDLGRLASSPTIDAVDLPPPPVAGPPLALLIAGSVVLVLALIGLVVAFV